MEEIAQVYSRSLFEVAKDHDNLDRIRDELGAFADALAQHRELSVFFFSPYFSTQEKEDGLRRTVLDADPTLVNFLQLLIENHRLPVIHRVRRQFDVLWDRENRRLPVELTSAVELEPAVVQELELRIREQTGQNLQLASKVNPDILGGIVLRVGNSILDASIRHRLEQLRKEVAKAA
ncbi:MAG: ATP synthase F1 subunit delta [Solirubrobacterales bacterium]